VEVERVKGEIGERPGSKVGSGSETASSASFAVESSQFCAASSSSYTSAQTR
jgi:hypothetical protein